MAILGPFWRCTGSAKGGEAVSVNVTLCQMIVLYREYSTKIHVPFALW
jgi:hypothetical protein